MRICLAITALRPYDVISALKCANRYDESRIDDKNYLKRTVLRFKHDF
jgi:hypothetical protein